MLGMARTPIRVTIRRGNRVLFSATLAQLASFTIAGAIVAWYFLVWKI